MGVQWPSTAVALGVASFDARWGRLRVFDQHDFPAEKNKQHCYPSLSPATAEMREVLHLARVSKNADESFGVRFRSIVQVLVKAGCIHTFRSDRSKGKRQCSGCHFLAQYKLGLHGRASATRSSKREL